MPERTVHDPRLGLGLARLLHITARHRGTTACERRVRVEREAGHHVAESRLRARRPDADRDERTLPRRIVGGTAQRAPELLWVVDREIGVHGAADRARAGAAHEFLRGPSERRCGAERARLHEHVRLGHVLGHRADRRRDVAAREDQHALRRDRRLQAAHRVLDQRLLRDEREQWLGARRGGERPEPRADATGEDHPPEGDVRLGFMDRDQLFIGQCANGTPRGGGTGGEPTRLLHRLLRYGRREIVATAPTISAIASTRRPVSASPAKAQPSSIATTGFTNA